nr:probable serine hydrolase [Halyomorpha halys]
MILQLLILYLFLFCTDHSSNHFLLIYCILGQQSFHHYKIICKWWGCRQTQPIITTHGLFDNAGSFDTLLPLLNTKSVLCLDLPGHGLSSHFPDGLAIHFQQYLLVLRYIFTEYYKWNKVSLMCHSFGSSVGFAYAGFYPEHIDRMVNLDCGRFWTAGKMKTLVEDYRASTDGFNNDLESHNNGQGFSWEETISKLYEGRVRFGLPISRKSCEIIAKRGAVQYAENKYRFTHDKRLRYRSFGRCTTKLLSELAERISCDVLNISPSNGINIHYSSTNYDEWQDNMKKLNKGTNLIDVKVEGGHHVHLENPEIVAPFLNDFFKS